MYEYISTSFLLAITVAILWLVNYTVSVYRAIKKYAHIPGPEPTGIKGFLFGNVPTLIEQDGKGVSYMQYMASLVPVYGKTFKFRLLNNVVIFTIEPKLVKQIYIDENFKKPSKSYALVGYPGGERFMGDGLVTELNHEKWRHRRALYNPGFHKQILMSFMREFNEKGNVLVDFLTKKADGKTEVVLLDQFNHIALDIIASLGFSMKVDSVNAPNNKLNTCIFEALAGIKHYYQDPLIKYKPHRRAFLNKHRSAIRILRDTGREQILQRLEMIKDNQELPHDILTVILRSHENGVFDLEAMVDDFVTFFVGGQETTASLLASIFLELARNIDVLEKVKAEIDAVVGSKSEISYAELQELQYTKCCIKETLRLWPPVLQTPRNIDQEIEAEHFVIPTGARITTSTYASSRCEEYFHEPFKFSPERFMNADESSENTKNYVYYPFSLGPRNCIGQNFAQIEVKVLMAKIMQNFDFKLVPGQSMAEFQAGTLRPKDGTKCYLTLRNSTCK